MTSDLPLKQKTARQVSDDYLEELGEISPITALYLGLPNWKPQLDDMSPRGIDRRRELIERTLTALNHADSTGEEKACSHLLSERLQSELDVINAGEPLRNLSNLEAPVNVIYESFTLLPLGTYEQRQDVVAVLRAVPQALNQWIGTLETGIAQGLLAGGRVLSEVIAQLDERLSGDGYFPSIVSEWPTDELFAEAQSAAEQANVATAQLREYLAATYSDAALGQKDVVGLQRYQRCVKWQTGATLDLNETYRWGWEEVARINAEMRTVADSVLKGATVDEAFVYLDGSDGDAIEGVENVREYLQSRIEEAIIALDGRVFDIVGATRQVETRIAPPGAAAAPYYSPPSLDGSRPGITWLPTQGRTRFPLWDLISTWYHEGVPGHHLQFAQWTLLQETLSKYQMSEGVVSANVEGWALYAERLMNELGLLRTPGERLGYLDAQRLRAIRVVIDIGMHCEMAVPSADSDLGNIVGGVPGAAVFLGETMTPDIGHALLRANCASPQSMIDSEIVRYLGLPAQAIGYKVGERVWMTGRENARLKAEARGEEFDTKSWHMRVLSLGSQGLDDLAAKLSEL